jgi:hypothetical protein
MVRMISFPARKRSCVGLQSLAPNASCEHITAYCVMPDTAPWGFLNASIALHHHCTITAPSQLFTMAGVTYDIYLSVVIAVVLVIVYPIYLAVTRLYFSPISHIPGPKLVAISGWSEFYYDYFKSGKYIFEIKKMHERYG